MLLNELSSDGKTPRKAPRASPYQTVTGDRLQPWGWEPGARAAPPRVGSRGLGSNPQAPLPLPGPRRWGFSILVLLWGTDRQKKRDRRQTGTAETCREVLFITYVNIVFTEDQSERREGKD